MTNQLIYLFIAITLMLSSCGKTDNAFVTSEPVKGGNQTPGGDGGNNGDGADGDDDWNQSAGGNGGYNGNPTKTATSTPTATSSGGVTATATSTATATATTSITATATSTATATATTSITATATSTATATATTTGQATFTSTATATPTKTFTATFTPTNTSTANPTKTFTATNTPTSSPTNHCTHTATPTPTATCTAVHGIPGCTVAQALNFNPQATQDNGSCQFKACLDKNFEEYSGDNIVTLIQNYATQHQLNVSQFVQSTCKKFITKTTYGYCCGCYNPVVTKGMACPGNCSQKFTANPHCYWSYVSCSQNRILQAYHSNGALKFKTYQPVSYCTSTPTKGALYQYAFGVNYETTLHVKKLARPIAYAPQKLYPNDPRLKGKTYLSFKNTIGLMLNADFSIKQFVHGKGNDFTPSASCTVTYEVRGHYQLNNSTGLMHLQTPGQNIATIDQGSLSVDPSFTQSPFWIKIKKQGDSVSCHFQAGNTYPTSWSISSPTPQTVKGWDGQTVLNAIIGPKFQAGIILNAHSLEGIEVFEYKQLNP